MIQKPIFQYYPADIKAAKPIGDVNLIEFISSVKNPSDEIKSIFQQISKAEADGNMELKAKLKQENLFYFTPCVFIGWDGVKVKNDKGFEYLSYRCYDNIESFTGLAVLDFDHIDNAEKFRDFIFNKYKFVWCAFVSSSKRGVKFLIKIPIAKNIDEFKEYFYGLGFEFDKYKGFDGTAQNSVLPLFLSYDPEIVYRKNPETFKSKGAKLDAFKVTSNVIPFDFKVKEGDEKKVCNNIKKAFDAIISDGHPQVIAACVSLGGYVASGYITQADAESLAYALIEGNSYLQKGVSGYKKTAKTAIQTGMQSNLILK